MAINYTESDYTKKRKEYLEGVEAVKPGEYQSQYSPAISEVRDKLLNRKAFQYDVNEDALYQQMKDNYVRQGRMAMQDTMGQAATMTGGYGNSYAQGVGQQAYNGYLQRLNDSLPEYYQMAQNAYEAEGDQLKEQYGLLSDQESQAYSRYMDSWNLWQQEYQNAQSAYESGRNFDYGAAQDQAPLAQAQVKYLISRGIMPNEDLLAAAGYDQQYVNEIIKGAKAKNVTQSSGGNSSLGKKESDSDSEKGSGMTTNQMLQNAIAAGATDSEFRQLLKKAPGGGSIRKKYTAYEDTNRW